MAFRVGIGTSQKSDPDEAADEAISEAVSMIGFKPTFALLFSTIDYKNNDGLKKINKKLQIEVSNDTPIIGGTVAGFMVRKGQFTKGIAVLLVYTDSAKVIAGFGENTKRDPLKATKNASKTFLKNNDSAIIEFTSGPIRPRLPILGEKFVVKSKLFSSILISLMGISTTALQRGFGREEEVLRHYANMNPRSKIIGGSTCDDNKVLDAYEFFNGKILQNSTVAIQINNVPTKLYTIHGYNETGKNMKITKMSSRNRIITEIDGLPAMKKFCEVTEIPESGLDESLHRKTFFIPFGYRDKVNFICPMAVGGILGDSFYFSHGVEGNNLEMLTSSGKNLREEAKKMVDTITTTNPSFVFGIGCVSWIATLGRKLDIIRNEFNRLGSNYFVAFTMGEDYYNPNEVDRHTNESFNSLSFFDSG